MRGIGATGRPTPVVVTVAAMAVVVGLPAADEAGAGFVEVVAAEGQPAPGTPDLLITSDDGLVHVEVDLLSLAAGDDFEAILRVRLPALDCLADIDGDGVVAFSDILEVLTAWGACPGCRADIDGDCAVAFSDILEILTAWGPCD